jgi:hypothetical protein
VSEKQFFPTKLVAGSSNAMQEQKKQELRNRKKSNYLMSSTVQQDDFAYMDNQIEMALTQVAVIRVKRRCQTIRK